MAVYSRVGIFASMATETTHRTGRGQVQFPDKHPLVENCADSLEKRIAELEKRVALLERLINACAQHIGIRV